MGDGGAYLRGCLENFTVSDEAASVTDERLLIDEIQDSWMAETTREQKKTRQVDSSVQSIRR